MTDTTTIEAGPDADIAFAKVAGLPLWDGVSDANLSDGFLSDDYRKLWTKDGGCERWHPSTNTGQAVDWADRWLKSVGWGWELATAKHWNVEFDMELVDYKSAKDVEFNVQAPTAALAAVRGMLAVAERMNKNIHSKENH